MTVKEEFVFKFKEFISQLQASITDESNGEWSIKGFIDIYKNVYTISSDTKIVSKILEIHLFPTLLKFAEHIGYRIILADFQNYYPDLTFVKRDDESIKFAVDLKTTFRRSNGKVSFTLGSHGGYFNDRTSRKNIQFPYKDYSGHFCLGIIYSKAGSNNDDENDLAELKIQKVTDLGSVSVRDNTERNTIQVDNLHSITSVIKDFQFFFAEKWKIASDSQGSGNTANIGSISDIDDIINERGVFYRLGEDYFDNYWLHYNTPYVISGKTNKITSIYNYLEWKGELESKKLMVGNGAKRYRQPQSVDPNEQNLLLSEENGN